MDPDPLILLYPETASPGFRDIQRASAHGPSLAGTLSGRSAPRYCYLALARPRRLPAKHAYPFNMFPGGPEVTCDKWRPIGLQLVPVIKLECRT